MMEIIKILYAPDGAAGGGGSGGEGGQAAAGPTGEAGAQAQANEGQVAADPRARAQAYKDFTRGEYKDLYDADVQRIVTQRLRSAKGAEESLGKIQGSLDLLKKTYGTDDLDRLNEAIMNDSRYYEDEAMKRGMDVETYKALQQKDALIEQYRQQQEAEAERQRQTQQVYRWRQEEQQLKQTFPEFDLETEMENSNGELFQMLNRGVSLEHAYLALHMDDIVGNTVQAAMMRGQQKTLEAVRANGLRPAENGAGDARAGKAEIDLSKLTSKQMRDIEKRLMRGETITAASFRT